MATIGEDLMCHICNSPNVICTCDPTWKDFYPTLSTECEGQTTDSVKYSSISVSTITVCFNFNQVVDLPQLKEKMGHKIMINYRPDAKKSRETKKSRKTEGKKRKKNTTKDSFYNSFDIRITMIDRETKSEPVISNVSIFIFPNGKVKVAGSKTIHTINLVINEIIQIITYVPGIIDDPKTFCAENVKIQMICSDFKIKPIKDDPDGWCIKQEDLKNILVHEHQLSATFSPLSEYPGINLKIKSLVDPEKNVYLFIFRSGSIIITAAKNARDISHCYRFITDVINKNASTLFYYDINEEIKQKNKRASKS